MRQAGLLWKLAGREGTLDWSSVDNLEMGILKDKSSSSSTTSLSLGTPGALSHTLLEEGEADEEGSHEGGALEHEEARAFHHGVPRALKGL